MRYFHDVISGLGDKLGPVLFQLPPNFKNDSLLLADFVNGFPNDMRAAFEFRHGSWFGDDVWEIFKSRNVALCLNETADFAAPKISTASYGYLRLRREDYAEADIQRWAEFVREQSANWTDAFVYFKHEEAGAGPRLAKQMMEILLPERK
jgi:uncharacterized protein YecE (DUF72 family)